MHQSAGTPQANGAAARTGTSAATRPQRDVASGHQDERRSARGDNWAEPFRISEATLIFDSHHHTAFAGLRASARSGRRVLFQSRDAEIDLEITQDAGPERVRLSGQVTPGAPDSSGGWLRMARGPDRWLTFLDETGEFRVEGLEPGYYELEVIYKQFVVEVPVLPISAGLVPEPIRG